LPFWQLVLLFKPNRPAAAMASEAFLRVVDRKYRDSPDSCPKMDFLIICPKEPFSELFSKIPLETLLGFNF